LAKKEKEDARLLRKRNTKALKTILEKMPKVTYKTKWSEAQKLLFKDPDFTQDIELQNMDKEDALIVFEDHIRYLEREHEEDIEKQKRWLRRLERKNRESFLCLLDELHEKGKLNSMSLWVDCFSTISADDRFTNMLGQPGSSPLDLFKFYAQDLKVRFHSDKKLIKEILKDNEFHVEHTTIYDKFLEVVNNDKRASSLDTVNLKLAFNNLMEKAEMKEKERLKEEQKKQKKIEHSFKSLLKKIECNENTKYEEIKEKIENEESYVLLQNDSERERLFNEFIKQLQETCLHHIKRKKKEKKKKRSRSSERSMESVEEGETESNAKSRSPSRAKEEITTENSQKIEVSENEGEIESDEDDSPSQQHEKQESLKKPKKHKKIKKRKKHKSESHSSENEGRKRTK